jgi:hypothetical protein
MNNPGFFGLIFNAVIFDLDNTLYDYSLCHEMALDEVATYLGYDLGDFSDIYSKVTKKFKIETGNTGSSHNRFIYFKWLKENLKLDYSVTEINNLYWNTYNNSWTVGSDNINIGCGAGQTNQGINAIALGYQAGMTLQRDNSVAIGNLAGQNFQKYNQSFHYSNKSDNHSV